jgi:hypothetical protein
MIACTQDHILPDECPECGGWLHTTTRGGFPGPVGDYCTEDCVASAQTWIGQQARDTHLYVRDLICDCEVCTAAGHPTPAELAEWADYHHGEGTR